MPLYEYECSACGHRFEKIQKFSDPPVETCPKCGGAVHKLIASPAFQFKGTGWYITDYAKKDGEGAKTGAADKDAASGDKDSSATKDSAATKEGAKSDAAKSAAPASSKAAESAPSAPAKPTGKD
jgi:putative FmdB family regulatory protein